MSNSFILCFFLRYANACVVLCLVAQSCPTLCDPMDCSPLGSSVHGDSPGKNTGVGCHVLLQGIFPTKGLNPGLPHCRQILYHLSHQGSPGILKWVAYPISRGSSWPRNQVRVFCIAGGFFTQLQLSYQESPHANPYYSAYNDAFKHIFNAHLPSRTQASWQQTWCLSCSLLYLATSKHLASLGT